MGTRERIAGAAVTAVITAFAVAGCGGGSGSSEASSSNASEVNASKTAIEASKAGEPEASKAFLTSKGENKIPKFGEEASAAEREAASSVLEENLQAREAGDWETQCATLTAGAVKEVKEIASIQGIEGGGCAKELKARAEPLQETKSLRVDSMTGPVDALRFKSDRAYALYHGIGGQDFAMPMEKEEGEWKVGALLEEAL